MAVTAPPGAGPSPRGPRPRSAGVLVALVLLTGVAAPAALAAPPATGPTGSYVVQAVPGALAQVTDRVERLGGRVTRPLAIIDAVTVDASPAAVARLRRDPLVEQVSENGRVQLASTTYDPAGDPASMLNVTQVTGAKGTWSKGVTGRGVDVALVDSGVTAVPGLDGAGKVVHGPDLSFESQSADTRSLDTFGHGTHLAGIIAGRDAGAVPGASNPSGTFIGMAPDARIVSVKVADAYGATDVSQVIAGIDWVVQHRDDPGLDIRVLNLAFGASSAQSYLLDPLAHAAEQAWHRGIVVVVSVGNDGTGTGRLLNPAHDPYLIAVGAENNNGTTGLSDDTIPEFSSRGDGVRNPDVVAPGASVQSLRVPGSWIDTQHPSGYLNERFFRGSGTSQAAAVVTGGVALLLQDRPGLTPDQVKALLRGTAVPLRAADPQAQGKGLIKVSNAITTSTPQAVQVWGRSAGNGSLGAARGGVELVLDGLPLDGERDIFGAPFSAPAHALLAARGAAWTGGTWNGNVWTGSAWSAGSWEPASWSGDTWSGRTWAGRTWATGSWTGRTWAAQSWADPTSTAAGTLTGRTWAGRTWAGAGFTVGSWR